MNWDKPISGGLEGVYHHRGTAIRLFRKNQMAGWPYRPNSMPFPERFGRGTEALDGLGDLARKPNIT
jgi:hypothetical protein